MKRLLSVLVAFAIATLLAFGGNAAYADDVSPTPAAGSAGSVDPTPTDTPADTPSPTSSAPAAGSGASSLGGSSITSGSTSGSAGTKTAPATKKAPTSAGAGTTKTAPATKPTGTAKASKAATSGSFTAQFSSIVSAALASQCDPQHNPVLIGTFEMDGNTCLDSASNQDWDNTGAHIEDGAKDSTAYTQGDSESTPSSSWHTGGSSQGKDDITDAWSNTELISGEVWTFFAVHRVAAKGTTTYDVELNQNQNSAPQQPDRTVGDLLLQFSVNGTGPLAFDKAYEWTAKANFNDPGCFKSGTTGFGWCPLTTVTAPQFESRTSTDGLFAEGALNLSALAGANGNICTGHFGQMNIRTVASESHTAALQDYVLPFDVSVPSTCGSIVINKFDSGTTALGGAHFTISPDPTPGSNAAGPIALVDGGAGDADGLANGVITISPAQAGDYTVTETQAPAGYFLPADPAQTITLASGAGETATFNFHDPKQWQALTATKTANATYTAQYAWSIAKEISADGNAPWVADSSVLDPLVRTVPTSGDPTGSTLSYRVAVTEGTRTTSAYEVSGELSVTNPNTDPVTADLSDSLPGATCLVEGSATDTVAVASGTHTYPYVCTFAGTPTADQLSGTNTATVSWDKSDYPQTQGDIAAAGSYSVQPTAPYAFGAETTSIDKTVTITDDHQVFPGGFQVTWSAAGHVTTSDVYTIPFEAPAGGCSPVTTNTATLTGSTTPVLGTDQASGKVCAASNLSITRIDARGFTRTYPWSISKSTSTPRIDVANGVAQAHYSVTVSAGDGADSGWAMSGTITAHNPNTFEAVSITSVPVVYTGGGTCAVTGETAVSIAAGGTHEFAYSCSFTTQPSYTGSVQATLNWDQATAGTATGTAEDDLAVTDADWTKTLVNASVTVHDDHANGEDHVLGTLNWSDVYAMPNHQQVIDYTVDLSGLPSLGECNDHVNTAWILGDGATHLDSDQSAENNSATVEVCNPTGLGVSDDAAGDFTRTFGWKIDKFIDGDQKSQTVTTEDGTATFDYTVVATPLGAVDTGWTITGSVEVTNKNVDPDIAPITVTGVQEVLDLGTTSTCTYDKAVPFDLASGQSADVGFTCTLDPTPDNDGAVPPTYQGSHSATVTGGPDGTTSSNAADLTWNDPTEVDPTLAVYDNEVTESADPVHLGDATWNADGTPSTFTYSLTFSVPEGTEGTCAPPFENLAWLGGDGLTPTDLQSGASAVICVPAVVPPVVVPPVVVPPVVNPPVVVPPVAPLPDTGGPDVQLLGWGLALLVTGSGLVLLTSRRRERRS